MSLKRLLDILWLYRQEFKGEIMKNLQSRKDKKPFIIFGVIIAVFIFLYLLRGAFCIGVLFVDSLNEKVNVNTDIGNYQTYIGKDADEDYKDKWGMDESIFPQKITDNMNVKDYKMVYYNPWDAQYLSYLVVQYDTKTYKEEVERLKVYPSNEYLGYYGAEGFNEKYELLAINADSYLGFVYALTDQNDTIVYVEIIFCNYFMDLDYKKYINEEFLPKGFDATNNNSYKQKMKNQKS